MKDVVDRLERENTVLGGRLDEMLLKLRLIKNKILEKPQDVTYKDIEVAEKIGDDMTDVTKEMEYIDHCLNQIKIELELDI